MDPIEFNILWLQILATISMCTTALPPLITYKTAATVLGCMAASTDDVPAIQEHGCHILSRVAEYKAAHGEKGPIREGSIQLIVHTLQLHLASPAVVHYSLICIGNLTQVYARLAMETVNTIEFAGGLEEQKDALVRIMGVLDFIEDMAVPVVSNLPAEYKSQESVQIQIQRIMSYFQMDLEYGHEHEKKPFWESLPEPKTAETPTHQQAKQTDKMSINGPCLHQGLISDAKKCGQKSNELKDTHATEVDLSLVKAPYPFNEEPDSDDSELGEDAVHLKEFEDVATRSSLINIVEFFTDDEDDKGSERRRPKNVEPSLYNDIIDCGEHEGLSSSSERELMNRSISNRSPTGADVGSTDGNIRGILKSHRNGESLSQPNSTQQSERRSNSRMEAITMSVGRPTSKKGNVITKLMKAKPKFSVLATEYTQSPDLKDNVELQSSTLLFGAIERPEYHSVSLDDSYSAPHDVQRHQQVDSESGNTTDKVKEMSSSSISRYTRIFGKLLKKKKLPKDKDSGSIQSGTSTNSSDSKGGTNQHEGVVADFMRRTRSLLREGRGTYDIAEASVRPLFTDKRVSGLSYVPLSLEQHGHPSELDLENSVQQLGKEFEEGVQKEEFLY